MEWELEMAGAPANCFPLKFHGIPRNSDFPLRIWWIPWELMGEGKDLPNIAIDDLTQHPLAVLGKNDEIPGAREHTCSEFTKPFK